MKLLSHITGLVIVVTVALWVAAGILPKLLPVAAAIFTMTVIGRLVWFWTQRW
jgi:hypothetical protein